MVTSIVLTGTHSIGIDSFGKFFAGDNKVYVKDVPFVRYRFDKYEETELNYIKQMKEKFSYSSHMAEITLGNDTAEIINKLEEIPNLIKYVYVIVTDKEVSEGISQETLNMMNNISDSVYDRLMLKDKSSTLDTIASIKLKKQLEEVTDFEYKEIGICSSPLSFNDENACLTALKARELSAEYAESDEVALPTANHECMNCCGCIKYHVFDSDVKAPDTKRGFTKASDTKKTESNSKDKVSKPKKQASYLKW